MHPISTSNTQNIIALANQGLSTSQISSQTGLGRNTCHKVIRKELPTIPKPKPGQPNKLSPQDCQSISRNITSGDTQNAAKLTRQLNKTLSNPVSAQTVRNTLKEADLEVVTKVDRPKLTPAQRSACL